MKNILKFVAIGTVLVMMLSACGGGAGGNTVSYTLVTSLDGGQMHYVGSGGDISGMSDPTLRATVGDTVKITLTSGDLVEHDISLPDFNVTSEHVMEQGSTTTITFVADKSGTFVYNCTIPGHSDLGMKGEIIIAEKP
jgi:nitrite reductase (NO-forming)